MKNDLLTRIAMVAALAASFYLVKPANAEDPEDAQQLLQMIETYEARENAAATVTAQRIQDLEAEVAQLQQRLSESEAALHACILSSGD